MRLENTVAYTLTGFLFLLVACNQGGSSSPATTPTASTTYVASKTTDNTLTTLNSLTLDTCIQAKDYTLHYTYTASQTQAVSSTTGTDFFELSANNDRAVQTFVVPEDGTLASLRLRLATPMFGNQATVSILEGGPVGLLRAQNSVAAELSTPTWLQVNFLTTVNFIKNKTYSIQLQRGISNVRWYRSATSVVADSIAFTSTDAGANWQYISSSDFNFELIVRTASATWQYNYNGVASARYNSYPASQIISINGGSAGILNFTTNPTAPVSNSVSDTVKVSAN